MMHPYAQGNTAAARREAAKCVEELRKALQAPGVEGWKHVGIALAHAATIKAQLDDAFAIDELTKEEDEG